MPDVRRSAPRIRPRLLSRLRAELNSLRNRLALLIFAVTLVSIGTLYVYVAPGLRQRLVNERLTDLEQDIHSYAGPVVVTVRKHYSQQNQKEAVQAASLESNDCVSILNVVPSSGGQVAPSNDSCTANTSTVLLSFPVAGTVIRTRRLSKGTEQTSSGTVAEAALPVLRGKRVASVIVFSAPVADLVHSVATVRRQILIAGGIALLLALIGGYLTARWLALRVKRLEHAAERVAAGEFGRPIPVDSKDELGQLASTFNDMQEQLAQLDRARKQFIATASHELRTPVFSLGGFVELLEDEELDTETRKRFLGHVSDQVERLRKLSVDLLDLSRLESGALELRPEHVDVAELTASVSSEFELSAAERKSHVQLHVEPGTEAQCDPVRLAQIVRILIDNALTHNPDGTQITVDARRSNGHLLVAVADNGEGIARAALSRIFEPFFTTDDGHGSGLGLAIASELAERMQGQLTASSQPGDTVFHLELPAG